MKHRAGKLNRWLLTGCILFSGEMQPFLLEGKETGPPVTLNSLMRKNTDSRNPKQQSEDGPSINTLALNQVIGGFVLQLQDNLDVIQPDKYCTCIKANNVDRRYLIMEMIKKRLKIPCLY